MAKRFEVSVLARDLIQADDLVLRIDPDQIENFEFSIPRDVHDVTPEGATYIERKLGKAHLTLTLHFKEGYIPTWVEKETDNG